MLNHDAGGIEEGVLFPCCPFSPQVQMKAAENNPFVSSWPSRRGDSQRCCRFENSNKAARRSLRPPNDRHQSCQIHSFGCVELISRFKQVCCKFSANDSSWLSSFFLLKLSISSWKGKKSRLNKFNLDFFISEAALLITHLTSGHPKEAYTCFFYIHFTGFFTHRTLFPSSIRSDQAQELQH